MGWFEAEILTTEENLAALTDLNGESVVRACTRTPMDRLVLDMDSSVSPTYGEQEGSAYNGHFGQTCDHPLFCFNQYGDLERAQLRNGNRSSSGSGASSRSRTPDSREQGASQRAMARWDRGGICREG